jgi:hypothetical protein
MVMEEAGYSEMRLYLYQIIRRHTLQDSSLYCYGKEMRQRTMGGTCSLCYGDDKSNRICSWKCLKEKREREREGGGMQHMKYIQIYVLCMI